MRIITSIRRLVLLCGTASVLLQVETTAAATTSATTAAYLPSSTSRRRRKRGTREGWSSQALLPRVALRSTRSSSTAATASGGSSSERLRKAELLLDQITSDDLDDVVVGRYEKKELPPPVPAVNGATAAGTAAMAIKRNGAVSVAVDSKRNGVVGPKAVDDDATVVVPDAYWNNGHLLSNGDVYANGAPSSSSPSSKGFVTRWARGVKVAEPLVKYDPVAAERLLFRQPAKWIVRNFQIALPIGWWAASVVIDYLSGNSKQNRRERAQQLRKAITDLGPAIIKGGQALASRPDLLPSEYLEELQKLQDDVPRFSNKVALRTVEEELNVKFEDVFELLQAEPVAAASIGQVYKARLIENQETVALKIQRPGCEEIIALDLYVLRWWSGIYNQIFKALNRDIDVQSIIDDFGELIYREIDYVAEAANAQRFNELYAGVKDVFVPKIYSDLTTRKVLTMEWVDGFRLTDHDALAKYGLEESKLVDTLVQCSLRQILGKSAI